MKTFMIHQKSVKTMKHMSFMVATPKKLIFDTLDENQTLSFRPRLIIPG